MITNTRLGIKEIIGDKRDQILESAAKHGAMNVRVFGSVARGEARPDSDVDLLVDWDMGRITSWGGVGFDIEVQALLGRSVDVVEAKQLHPLIKQQVIREAIPLEVHP